MKFEIAHREILEYLDKYGQVNTFRLSRYLKINRAKLIKLVKELTKRGLVEFKHGVVVKVKKKSKKIKKTIKLRKTKKKIQKEKKEVERDISLKRREEAVKKRGDSVSVALKKLKEDKALLDKEREGIGQKINEAVGLEKEKIAKARKRLRKERKQISKARVLKENINKLEANLEDLKKKIGIEKGKLKKIKEKKIKPRIIRKKIEKPKAEWVKPALKPEIEQDIEKIGVSKTETKQPGIMPEEQLQPAVETEENVYDRFHNLIEKEIDLLKQKKIDEARNIHLQIKDTISEVIESNQRKIIVKDWNRIKEFY